MSTRRQTSHWKQQFLAAFRRHGNVTRAATAAGVERTTAYKWRESDARFAAQWADAELEATEHLEGAAHDRAVEGVREPVFWHGEEVGYIRKYSDRLLIFLLKARAPQKYRDNVHAEHDGELTIKVVYDDVPLPESP
ncbi:MAG TPA: terminase [Chloroflexota bacterium]|nr:terminase [Chloroflexota bacterium]